LTTSKFISILSADFGNWDIGWVKFIELKGDYVEK